jgi:hypothetical protein
MRLILLPFLLLLPALLSGETLKLSARVLDRATDGSAVRGQYLYPSVQLESGETGNLHLGREVRYPVGTQRVRVGENISKKEMQYEERPIGLELSIRFEVDGGTISYLGRAKSTLTRGTVNGMTLIDSADAIFHGETRIGDVVEVRFAAPDGTEEEILLFFGPPDE